MLLTDLPDDIIVLIFPYLTASDFLSLTSITKSFLPLRQDPAFWRILTRSTFRIPPQPLLQADGPRWQWLYQNLRTRTHVYTWGNNERANLGHSRPSQTDPASQRADRPLRRTVGTSWVGWPTEMEDVRQRVGVVADVQCGGWSTVLLNSIGQLFAVGVLNAEASQMTHTELCRLSFPAYYPSTTKERYEPSTAIRQYSVGRLQILGLSDDGTVWQWVHFDSPARYIKSAHVDMMRNVTESSIGCVTRVAAGWARSSVYANGSGISYWEGLPLHGQPPGESDGFLIETVKIPGTAYKRNLHKGGSYTALDLQIGEVINHIVMEQYIVFVTDSNKVFAFPAHWPNLDPRVTPVELTTFSPSPDDGRVHDIQGSFRSFAVFTTNGSVFIGKQDHLKAFCKFATASPPPRESSLPIPIMIRSLQRSSVISVAFGDYHFHALFADGTISSYGTEPRACGAFGFGPPKLARLRGVRYVPVDGILELPSWSEGRRTVWIEPEKEQWLEDMENKSKDGEIGTRGYMVRLGLGGATQVCGEWFEREGRNWSRGPGRDDNVTEEDSKDEIGAYFALKISAAGWHSAALVLVDREKAAMVRRKYLIKKNQRPVPVGKSTIGEGSDVEQVAALEEQLVTLVSRLGSWIGGLVYRMVYSFLGLTARNAAASLGTAGGQVTDASSGDEQYVWHDQPFPRLRLPNGQEMTGEIPLTPWRGGEPVFSSENR